MKLKVKHIPSIMLCIYIVVVAVLCFMKTDSLPSVELHFLGIPIDKLAHFIMFMPYPILVYLMFFDRNRSRLLDLCILAVCIAMGIGTAIGTEQLQAMTQYRTPDINDVYADMKGMAPGCIGVLIYILIKKRIGQK